MVAEAMRQVVDPKLCESHTIAASIQPLPCTHTRTAFGNLSFGIVFLLNITYGGNFLPSAVIASITVQRCSSHPLVRVITLFPPFPSIVVFVGISKYKEFDPRCLFVITSSYCFFSVRLQIGETL
jgi:hypothetical protein